MTVEWAQYLKNVTPRPGSVNAVLYKNHVIVLYRSGLKDNKTRYIIYMKD